MTLSILFFSLHFVNPSSFADSGDVVHLDRQSIASDCETFLKDSGPINLEAAKSLHHGLLKKAFVVAYVNPHQLSFETLGLNPYEEIDLGSTARFTEVDYNYLLQVGAQSLDTDLTFPPLQVWIPVERNPRAIARITRWRDGRISFREQQLRPEYSVGTLINPTHVLRPYLEAKHLFVENKRAGRVILGVHVRCDNRLAKTSPGVRETRTAIGWLCRVPILILAVR